MAKFKDITIRLEVGNEKNLAAYQIQKTGGPEIEPGDEYVAKVFWGFGEQDGKEVETFDKAKQIVLGWIEEDIALQERGEGSG